MSEEEKNLRNFLLDIQCLDRLSKWSEKFNLFDTLKLTEVEIRHSDMLAWLLDPHGNHGLGDEVLRRLIQELVKQSEQPQEKVFQTLLMNLGSIDILREYSSQQKRIDLLAVSHKERFLICIENKIRSGEHDDQLSVYYKLLKEKYSGYDMMFAFLTPDGTPPDSETDRENWRVLSYGKVMDIIETVAKEKTLHPDVETVIRHYTDTIRRHIVGDKELEKVCKEIYSKHKAALDLLFEYRSNRAKLAAEEIKKWCKEKANAGEIVFDPVAMDGKVGEIAFTTSFMTGLLPDFDEQDTTGISGWNDKHMYHYAIFNKAEGVKFSVRLICSGKNLSEDQEKACRDLCGRIKGKQREEGWQWWTLKTISSFPMGDQLFEEEYHKKLVAELDKALERVEAFEKSLGKE